ncbi:MAG: hypothetical protein K8S54_13430 [Spirochaetia bacterium]|nr:hypothetical protein [Spirochaetia bacterium]
MKCIKFSFALFLFILPLFLRAEESHSKGDDFKNTPEAEVTERISFLQQSFDETYQHSRLWHDGWLAVYGLSAVAGTLTAATTELPESRRSEVLKAYALGADQRLITLIAASAANTQKITDSNRSLSYALYGTDGLILTTVMQSAFDKAEKIHHAKQDAIVNAWTSAIAFGATAATPYPAAYASKDFREMASSTPLESRTKLAQGETWLAESAEAEIFGRSAISHFLNLAVAAASGLALTSGYNRSSRDGWTMFGSNLVTGELAIFTQPTRTISSWKSYKAKYYPSDAAKVGVTLQLRAVVLTPRGFAVSFAF